MHCQSRHTIDPERSQKSVAFYEYDYGRASVVRYRVRYNLELRPRRALFAP